MVIIILFSDDLEMVLEDEEDEEEEDEKDGYGYNFNYRVPILAGENNYRVVH